MFFGEQRCAFVNYELLELKSGSGIEESGSGAGAPDPGLSMGVVYGTSMRASLSEVKVLMGKPAALKR